MRTRRAAAVLGWAPIAIGLGVWVAALLFVYTVAYVVGGPEAMHRLERLISAALQ